MAAESRTNNQVVVGRTVASSEQTPYTIKDQIHRKEMWRDDSRAQQSKDRLQQEIDDLTEAGERLGMNTLFTNYMSQKKQEAE